MCVESKLQGMLNSLEERFTSRIGEGDVSREVGLLRDEFTDSMRDFKQSVLDMKNTTEFLVNENIALKAELNVTKEQLKETNKAVSVSKVAFVLANDALSRAREVESSGKVTNIVVYGIDENEKSSVQETKFKKFLIEQFKLDCEFVDAILFKDVFRMGSVQKGRSPPPRPLKVQFVRMSDKRRVMGVFLADRKNYLSLGFCLRDDLPFEIRSFRTAAYKLFVKLFRANKTPRFVGSGAVCDDVFFANIDELTKFVGSLVIPDEAAVVVNCET